MEKQLFDWEYDDVLDMDSIDSVFYNVTLVVDVGDYKKGQRFRSAMIDYDYSVLTLRDYDDEDHRFHLRLKPGIELI